MDTVTHGIVGSLLAKGYFSERHGRVATFAAIIGATFPDVDVVSEIFSRDPLAVVKFHRGITHSWFGLPFFAVIFAWLTRWIARRLGMQAPSWMILSVIYGVAIASHIVLDGMTSFGTRMWTPLGQDRVAWDLLFIIDFVFTAIVLLPQVAAWVHRKRERKMRRAISMWVAFTVATFLVWQLARGVGFPFHPWIGVAASALIAMLFFLPGAGDWGGRLGRAAWCRGGAYAMVAYFLFCGAAHHAAIQRVADFAAANHIDADRMAALPLPPSLLDWGGVIRTSNGVYASRFDLRDSATPSFYFTADSPPDIFMQRALRLPEVQLYWAFARFPIIRSSTEGGYHVVDFFDQRFISRRRRDNDPQPFTYRVVFDSAGEIIEEGWQSNGLLLRRVMKTLPLLPRPGSAP
jgi:membrane-bound metal-dependent hydrolase YbcI (DUF457 family)